MPTAVPANLLPTAPPARLLTMARQGLAEAAQTHPDGLRYAAAHLAALRAAAAIVGARTQPTRQRTSRIPSIWVLLAQVAPEMGEWATHFAGLSSKRAAAEAGIPRVVTAYEADDLLRTAEQFVDLAAMHLGLHRTTDSAKEA